MKRITKAEYNALGGMSSGKTARKQSPSGRWHYYRTDF